MPFTSRRDAGNQHLASLPHGSHRVWGLPTIRITERTGTPYHPATRWQRFAQRWWQ